MEYLNVSGFYLERGKEKELVKPYAQEILSIFPNLKEISLPPDSSTCPDAFVREIFLNLLTNKWIWDEPMLRWHSAAFGLKTKIRHHDAGDHFVRRLFDHFEVFEFEHEVAANHMKSDRVTITKKSNSKFEFSVTPKFCEVFSDLDPILAKVNKCCRDYYNESHRHNCGCEFDYCPKHSYTENLLKGENIYGPYDWLSWHDVAKEIKLSRKFELACFY